MTEHAPWLTPTACDQDEPEFPRHSDRWTDFGWPEQQPTDPYAFARHEEQKK